VEGVPGGGEADAAAAAAEGGGARVAEAGAERGGGGGRHHLCCLCEWLLLAFGEWKRWRFGGWVGATRAGLPRTTRAQRGIGRLWLRFASLSSAACPGSHRNRSASSSALGGVFWLVAAVGRAPRANDHGFVVYPWVRVCRVRLRNPDLCRARYRTQNEMDRNRTRILHWHLFLSCCASGGRKCYT
jgi:hypothetical protein